MGIAYLPDGQRMDYEQYLQSKEWKNKKANRLAFDNWQCGICHAELTGAYETHHLNYARLGHEDVETDIISLCTKCHKDFHSVWERGKSWEGTPISHWKEYSLKHTAQLCYENLHNDYFYGGKMNLCSLDQIHERIDDYFATHETEPMTIINDDDVRLYFRNKRYEVLFDAQKNGENLEDMLDRMFGTKASMRGEGGNHARAAARSFLTKHKPGAMKRIYNESSNLLILMNEVIILERNISL